MDHKYKKWNIPIICLQCNNEFWEDKSHADQKFCSVECYDRYVQNKNVSHKRKRHVPEPYTVETSCKCGCGTVIMNPDDHYRYRKFIAEHRNTNGTHPRLGKKESAEHLESRMRAIFKSFSGHYTGIENELYSYLDKIEVLYEKQFQIGHTRPDAFIPSLNLAIYADGEYWHNKEDVKERDKRCNKTILDKGYLCLRLNSIGNGYHLNLRPLQVFLLQNLKY